MDFTQERWAPPWAKLGTASLVLLSSTRLWGDSPHPSTPLQELHPGYSHRRTYWGRRKPSWGGAGPMGEEGKHQTSSLLLLLPPHRSEELVEP